MKKTTLPTDVETVGPAALRDTGMRKRIKLQMSKKMSSYLSDGEESDGFEDAKVERENQNAVASFLDGIKLD